jgi:pSer/pThr/pTyr-binding forkhead associated (FHA) protein
MRLIVKKAGQTIHELRFTKGPLHIGRHPHSQILLPDRAVSRQHAVIYTTQEGTWVVEDLDSANKTYLNDEAIKKAEIKTGDRLRVGDFEIDVELEAGADLGGGIHLEDTLVPDSRRPARATTVSPRKIITRKVDDGQGPDVTLPAARIRDFLNATEAICKANGPDEVLKTLLAITLRQFHAYHSWCALRNLPEGPMTSHAGKSRDGGAVEAGRIKVHEKITQAIETKEFVLVPRVSAVADEKKVGSAMIAPIIDPDGCFGVLYVDNALNQEPYGLSDLDYLIFLAIHTAAVVENF